MHFEKHATIHSAGYFITPGLLQAQVKCERAVFAGNFGCVK